MTEDTLPTGDMKYRFKAHVQAHGYAGDLIISSATVNDLVKSINLLERADDLGELCAVLDRLVAEGRVTRLRSTRFVTAA